ncbi:hypothetical protein J6590_027541 [Homalodisca vitripennis]|nr:hypothetical protein J6590_027541 [Homalodisca vitripennis]
MWTEITYKSAPDCHQINHCISHCQNNGWKDKPTPSKRPGGFSSSNETSETFTKETLRIHNEYRAKHGVPALSIDPEISKFAQAWADHLAEKNQFAHRTNSPYGENIFWSSASASAKVMCDSWYGEEAGYNYDVDPFKSGGGKSLVE